MIPVLVTSDSPVRGVSGEVLCGNLDPLDLCGNLQWTRVAIALGNLQMPCCEGCARGGGETEIERGRESERVTETETETDKERGRERERWKGRRGGSGAQHECQTVSLVTLWTAVRGGCDPQRYGRKSARAGVGEYRYENSPNGHHLL